MTFRDVMLIIDGFNDKREYEYGITTRLAMVMAHSGFNPKHSVGIMKKVFPPLDAEKYRQDIKQRAIKTLERLKKITDGRGVKVTGTG